MKLLARHISALIGILICLTASLCIYWDEEFQFYFVKNQSSLKVGDKILLADFKSDISKPLYIHFFDERCVDSKVSLEHLPLIIDRYPETCNYMIINGSSLTERDLRKAYQLPESVSIFQDSNFELTQQLNVPTTPHVLIIDRNQSLYFTGNYSDGSGLCSATSIYSSAPAVALRFLASNNQPPLFTNYQVSFTGCPIN